MKAVLLAMFLVALMGSVHARPGRADVRPWMREELPEHRSISRTQRVLTFLPSVRPDMSVTQVITLIGAPDHGITPKGKERWIEPRRGILQYTLAESSGSKGLERKILIYLDSEGRVDKIIDNGVLVARKKSRFFYRPLPRGVPWRP